MKFWILVTVLTWGSSKASAQPALQATQSEINFFCSRIDHTVAKAAPDVSLDFERCRLGTQVTSYVDDEGVTNLKGLFWFDALDRLPFTKFCTMGYSGSLAKPKIVQRVFCS